MLCRPLEFTNTLNYDALGVGLATFDDHGLAILSFFAKQLKEEPIRCLAPLERKARSTGIGLRTLVDGVTLTVDQLQWLSHEGPQVE